MPLPDWNAPPRPTAGPASPLPALHVQGTALRDESGQAVKLRGVNVCSLEFDSAGTNWQLADAGSALLDTLADPARWHVRAVRMPVNQQWLLEDDDYVARVERLIDDANRHGVYVLLDDHWELGRQLDPYDKNILEVPTFGRGNTTEAFWLRATDRWANRTNLLFDLINEPHGRSDAETAGLMQVLVDAVRSRGVQAPIVVGGMNWAHSVEYWADHPLAGDDVIYSAHEYLPTDTTDVLAAHFERPAAKIPVLVGEFLADPMDSTYALTVADGAEAAGAVGWLPWAVGCGFDAGSDLTDEPFRSLAERMRR